MLAANLGEGIQHSFQWTVTVSVISPTTGGIGRARSHRQGLIVAAAVGLLASSVGTDHVRGVVVGIGDVGDNQIVAAGGHTGVL